MRASHRRARGVQAFHRAKMQGMIIGPCIAQLRWAAAVHKFVARALHVKSLGFAWTDDSLACRMMAQSVVRFIGHVSLPRSGALHTEQLAIAMVVGAPMHSMGAGFVEHLFTAGARRDLGWIELLARASRFKLVAAAPAIQAFPHSYDAGCRQH